MQNRYLTDVLNLTRAAKKPHEILIALLKSFLPLSNFAAFTTIFSYHHSRVIDWVPQLIKLLQSQKNNTDPILTALLYLNKSPQLIKLNSELREKLRAFFSIYTIYCPLISSALHEKLNLVDNWDLHLSRWIEQIILPDLSSEDTQKKFDAINTLKLLKKWIPSDQRSAVITGLLCRLNDKTYGHFTFLYKTAEQAAWETLEELQDFFSENHATKVAEFLLPSVKISNEFDTEKALNRLRTFKNIVPKSQHEAIFHLALLKATNFDNNQSLNIHDASCKILKVYKTSLSINRQKAIIHFLLGRLSHEDINLAVNACAALAALANQIQPEDQIKIINFLLNSLSNTEWGIEFRCAKIIFNLKKWHPVIFDVACSTSLPDHHFALVICLTGIDPIHHLPKNKLQHFINGLLAVRINPNFGLPVERVCGYLAALSALIPSSLYAATTEKLKNLMSNYYENETHLQIAKASMIHALECLSRYYPNAKPTTTSAEFKLQYIKISLATINNSITNPQNLMNRLHTMKCLIKLKSWYADKPEGASFIGILINLLKNRTHPEIKAEACFALGKLNELVAPNYQEEVKQLLLKALLYNANTNVRKKAADAFLAFFDKSSEVTHKIHLMSQLISSPFNEARYVLTRIYATYRLDNIFETLKRKTTADNKLLTDEIACHIMRRLR